MIVTDHEMAALSLFHWKDESVLRCFVYCVTFLMFQFSCFRTGAADIMSNEIVWLSLDSQNHFSSFEISNPTGYVSCNPHLQRFSNVSSNFIMCASTSAKPVTFCEKCGEQYQGVLDVVEEIKKDHDCRDKLLNSDILQIVQKMNTFVMDLWMDGNCDNCFTQNQNEPPDVNYREFSNDTKQFLILFNQTQECFKTYNHTDTDIYGGDIVSNKTLCQKCRKNYIHLNEFYGQMGSIGSLCMDLVEMMNVTRQQWNQVHCTEHTTNYTSVVSISVFCCSLPVLFYLFAMFITRKRVILGRK
ncbi:osteopetrosis-associated transmembrane protein 1-like isoform X2 [Apostichopus japonicus]|uniref:osteopetrosis-associated transmembrane protein 1-like isoform X2 n=1 Tax=Stichopus japonicus TaxID=307972 RepID=UPI003AB6F83F